MEGRFTRASKVEVKESDCRMALPCGLELRAYCLATASEASQSELFHRSTEILAAPVPYDPAVDLIAKDLADTPAVIACIDKSKQYKYFPKLHGNFLLFFMASVGGSGISGAHGCP